MSRAFRLGIFVVSGLLIFAAAVFWIGAQRMMFRSTYRLNAEFPQAAGLGPGAQVRVAGIQKGSIRKIDLPKAPGQKVRVEMDLDSDTRNIVKKDSSAAIHNEGLMGDQFIEISVGTDQSPSVKDNDTLEGTPPVQISDLIKKADGLLDTASGAVNNLTTTSGNINAITSKINNGAGTMGALVNDRRVYQNLEQTTTEMQEDMEAVKHNFLLSHFFHKRGYEDAAQLTKNAIPRLPSVSPVRRFSWDEQEIFDKPGAAKLKDKQIKLLDTAGGFLQTNPFGLAVIAGYSDMKGDAAEQKVLTEARAMVVRDYLVHKFKMDDSRVKTIGLGKSQEAPAAGVEVLIYPQGTNAPAGADKQ